MTNDQDTINRRLADIEAIEFSDDIGEITASLHVVLTMYEIDDDPRIIGACKKKLKEGVNRLEALGEEHTAERFKPE